MAYESKSEVMWQITQDELMSSIDHAIKRAGNEDRKADIQEILADGLRRVEKRRKAVEAACR
jgi:hypothetical protein